MPRLCQTAAIRRSAGYLHGCPVLRCFGASANSTLFCNRKLGLRLETAGGKKVLNCLSIWLMKKKDIYIGVLVLICNLASREWST
jgi:hypothetical protein